MNKTIEEGFNAYLQGLKITQNPYAATTKKHSDWLEGWLAARDQEEDLD